MKKLTVIAMFNIAAVCALMACYGLIVTKSNPVTDCPPGGTNTLIACTNTYYTPTLTSCGTSTNITGYTCLYSSPTNTQQQDVYTNGTCYLGTCQGSAFQGTYTNTNVKFPFLQQATNCNGG